MQQISYMFPSSGSRRNYIGGTCLLTLFGRLHPCPGCCFSLFFPHIFLVTRQVTSLLLQKYLRCV